MKRKKTSPLLPGLLALTFLLGVYRGRIALWKDQDPTPVKILPYPVEMVPEPLQEALKAGIPIESMDDLEDLLKKYMP